MSTDWRQEIAAVVVLFILLSPGLLFKVIAAVAVLFLLLSHKLLFNMIAAVVVLFTLLSPGLPLKVIAVVAVFFILFSPRFLFKSHANAVLKDKLLLPPQANLVKPVLFNHCGHKNRSIIELKESSNVVLKDKLWLQPQANLTNPDLSNRHKNPSSAVELKESTDVYLSCRKDAIQMAKAAAKHLSQSRTAHLNGDHASAHQLSWKALLESIMADKLHAEAAKKILRIKNEGNDVWNLDLHGLHATEAVHALRDHLQGIESQPPPTGIEQKRESVLHVITGKGAHSGGRPVLPWAVRRFLSKNGYRYHDSRPGVIDVWPNFFGN